MDATSLSNTNSTKILELEDELATSLRDAIAGRDEIEIASFSEDEVIKIGAICARLAALIGIRDMTSWMEEDEGGKQSSAWDIINALAERGRLGYKEEELVRLPASVAVMIAQPPADGRSGIAGAHTAHHLEGAKFDYCDRRNIPRGTAVQGETPGAEGSTPREATRVRDWYTVQHGGGCQTRGEYEYRLDEASGLITLPPHRRSKI